MKTNFDIIVIGAGSGGLTTAVGFAKIGKSVLLIEKDNMGGECTNTGCIPSKALLHHAKTYHLATIIAGKNKKTDDYRRSAWSYVRSKINEVLNEETPVVFSKMGITVLRGEAEFISQSSVRVNDTIYSYQTAVIATGSSPRTVDIPGLTPDLILTNQNIFKLNEIPDRTLVIGSGPIGMEIGQALAMLGSQVTIASIDDSFARLEEPAIGKILEQKFKELGINIELRAFIKTVENGEAIFDRRNGNTIAETFTVPFDKILIAIGRVPNLPPGLTEAKIDFNEQCILVDSQYRTSNKQVYALGDVSQKLKFTHTADDAARQVVARVASCGLLRVNKRKAVPKVTYTTPEIAQVGISWTSAVAKFGEDRVIKIEIPFHNVDRAKTDNDTSGLLIITAKRFSGIILGANIIGPAAGEIITLFTLAIDQKISLWRLRSLIYAYPTYSSIVKKAGDKFLALQITNIKSDLLNSFKRHSPKFVALIFWVSLIFFFQHYRVVNNFSYSDILINMLDFFTSTIWGPLIYIAIYTIRPLILFPATPLTALSGALFGFGWGTFYTTLGANLSANLAYWVGRFFGKEMKLEYSIIGNWIEALRSRPFGTILFMRLFYLPFDLVNYGAGVLKIKWLSYSTATLIGIIPGSISFIALGSALDLQHFNDEGLTFNAFDPKFIALSVVIFISSILLSKFIKRKKS